MPPGGNLLAWGAGLAATGAGAVIGLTADTLRRNHSVAVSLGEADTFEEQADEERVVIAEDGVPLHVEIDEPRGELPEGIPVAPTVILVHGYTLALGSWVYQRRALREAGYRVVLYDQRGHGRSEEGETDSYTIEQLGRDLGKVIEEIVPEGPVVLAGHSMGGMTLMALGQERPELVCERVIGTAFVCTSAGELRSVDWGLGPGMTKLIHRLGPTALGRLSGREPLIGSLLKASRDIDSFVVHRYSFGSHVPIAVVRYVAKMIFTTPMSVIGGFIPSLMNHDRVGSLEAFNGIETLVLNGTEDKLTPPAHSEAIVNALPGAEHVVIERAGHVLMVEYPELVNEQLLQLLARSARSIESPRPRRRRVRKIVTDVALAKRARSVSTGKKRIAKAANATREATMSTSGRVTGTGGSKATRG